ncbi:MAG: metallophosphoesterase family protein [Planctomycetota bacterium]
MSTVCFIADTHRRHREVEIPECDILIHCGDLCSFRQHDRETIQDIDQWFAEQPVEHVLCVAGNHDFELEKDGFRFDNAELLTDRYIELEGLKIYGTPWCPDLSGFAFYRPDLGLKKAWRKIPAGLDILVTHTPPWGILDLPSSQSRHLGCQHLLAELDRINPRIHAFGHIHASAGERVQDGTCYINAAVVGGREMAVRNLPTLKSIEPE